MNVEKSKSEFDEIMSAIAKNGGAGTVMQIKERTYKYNQVAGGSDALIKILDEMVSLGILSFDFKSKAYSFIEIDCENNSNDSNIIHISIPIDIYIEEEQIRIGDFPGKVIPLNRNHYSNVSSVSDTKYSFNAKINDDMTPFEPDPINIDEGGICHEELDDHSYIPESDDQPPEFDEWESPCDEDYQMYPDYLGFIPPWEADEEFMKNLEIHQTPLRSRNNDQTHNRNRSSFSEVEDFQF